MRKATTDQWCGACSASWEWPVSIAKENRLDYYNALETYAVRGELGEFADLVAELEEQQLDVYIKLI